MTSYKLTGRIIGKCETIASGNETINVMSCHNSLKNKSFDILKHIDMWDVSLVDDPEKDTSIVTSRIRAFFDAKIEGKTPAAALNKFIDKIFREGIEGTLHGCLIKIKATYLVSVSIKEKIGIPEQEKELSEIGLSQKTLACLQENGITKTGDILCYSQSDLLGELVGFKKVMLEDLTRQLSSVGISLPEKKEDISLSRDDIDREDLDQLLIRFLGLPSRIYYALNSRNIICVSDIYKYSLQELEELPKIGKKSVVLIDEKLRSYGICLRKRKTVANKNEYTYELTEEEKICRIFEKQNGKRLAKFCAIQREKGVSKQTLSTQKMGISVFISYFMLRDLKYGYCTLESFLENKYVPVSSFLGDYFITHCMWSTPETMQITAAGIKKYFKFLLESKKISQCTYDDLKETIKEELPYWKKACRRFNNGDPNWYCC